MGSDPKDAKKQHRKIAGYISLQVAEVYFGKTDGNSSVDMLPFGRNKLPHSTDEAF
jgi:hypothetical protein